MDPNGAHFHSNGHELFHPSSAEAQDAQDGSANLSRKRRRVAIACPSCRLRKVKCDHIVTDEANGNMLKGLSKSSQSYIRSLEQRLQRFEEKAADTEVSYVSSSISGAHNASTPNGRSDSTIEATSSPLSGRRDSIFITANPDIFMGGSSGFSFTQLILNAMNRADSDRLQAQPLSSPRDYHNLPDTSDLFSLPADSPELMELFFGFHYELSPIFHAPTMLSKFHEAMECDVSDRWEHRYTLATMNMTFAIAASHQRSGREISLTTTRRYYDTAMALIAPTLLFDWRIEKVQILLLGARYLQSSNSPDECWNVLGLAIRIAYGLELHQAPGDGFDCITKEVRKRVWYACFGYDQLLSMIYGRPSATSSSTFNTPLPEDLDDDCIQHNRLLFPSLRTPSVMSFSIQVAKLYRLLESATSVADPQLEAIVHLDEAFEAWYANVPSHLKIQHNSHVHDDKVLILALRANMVRILIHRQSLALTLSTLFKSGNTSKSSESLKTSMLQNSRRICVRTAEETIQLVALRYEQTKNARGPSWFNLYYLFNAILIVVSHVVDPEYRDDKGALAQLDRAMQMIRQMSKNHLCAQRAYTFLHQLLGFMDSSITIDGRRPTGAPRPQPPFALPNGYNLRYADDRTSFEQNHASDFSETDLSTFWDITHDLTTNLGSQLESYSTLGTGLWSWGADEQPIDSGMYTNGAIN